MTGLSLLIAGCSAPGVVPQDGLPARVMGDPRFALLGNSAGDSFGSVAAGGDLNGDGHADLVAGSWATDDGPTLVVGELRAYLGSPLGLDLVPATVLMGDRLGDALGTAITIGDFDGDGYDDLAASDAGDWGDPDPDRVIDRVPVFPGGPDGLAAEPALTLEDDTAEYGWSLAAGDVNGDGFADLLVGDSLGERVRGRALLHLGGEAGLSVTPAIVLEGSRDFDQLGYDVVFLGDVDADGFGDVAINVPGADDGGEDAGKVQVHHGAPDGLEATPRAEILGTSVIELVTDIGAAGDPNGDGYADLLLGRAYAASLYEGRVDLHLGGPAGLDLVPAVILLGADLGGYELTRTHGVGDLNEDGYDDVAFKLDPIPEDAAVALLLGVPGVGLDPATGVEMLDVANLIPVSNFGTQVVSADFDGDTHLDLFVTDPYSFLMADLAGAGFLYAGDEDADADGHGMLSDCDDREPLVFPGAAELCDGLDQDCDGIVDDEAQGLPFAADRDQDGFTDPADEVLACPDPPEGYAPASELPDCDDGDPTRFPEADEVAGDGIDQDCDGADRPGQETADPVEEGDPKPEEPGGCGCATGGTGGAALVGMTLGVIRRRRRAPSTKGFGAAEPANP